MEVINMKVDSRGLRFEGYIAWPLYGPEAYGTWNRAFQNKAIVFDDPQDAQVHALRVYPQTIEFVISNVYYYENHILHVFSEDIRLVKRTYTNRFHTKHGSFYRQDERR